MTQIEWKELEKTVADMSVEDRARLSLLLRQADLPNSDSTADSLLGLLKGAGHVVDQVCEDAMAAREQNPLRTAD